MQLTKNIFTLATVTILSITILIFSCINIAGTSGNHLTGVYLGEADIRHINVSKILPSVSPVITVLAKALSAPNTNVSEIYTAMNALSASPALKAILQLLTESKDAATTIDALTTLAPVVVSNSSSDSLTDVVSLINNSNNSSMIFNTLSSLSSDSGNSSTLQAVDPVMELIANSNNVTATLGDLVLLSKAEALLPAAELESVLSLIQLGGNNVTATLENLSVLSQASKSLNITNEATLFVALEASYNKTAVLEGLIAQSNDTVEVTAYTGLYNLLSSSANSTTTIIDVATILLSSTQQNTTQLTYSEESILAVASLLENSVNATLTMEILPVLVKDTSSNPASATEAIDSLIGVLQSSKNSTLTLELLSELLGSSSSTSAATALVELLGASTNANQTLSNLVTVATLAKANSTAIVPLLSILKSSSTSSNITDADIYQNVLPELFDNMKFATNFKLGVFSLCKYNSKGELYTCTKPHAVQSFIMKKILFDELLQSSFAPYVKALDLTIDDVIIKGELPKKQHLYVPGVKAILAFAILTIIACVCVPALYITGLFEKVLRFFFTPLLIVNSLLVGIISAAIGGLVKHGLKHDKYNVTWKIGAAMYALAWVGFFLAIIAAFVVYSTTCKKTAPVDEENQTSEETEISEEIQVDEQKDLSEDIAEDK
ncbi:Cell membrane protein [Hanseniaspora uvarum DSM 2768]|nr:Cell membrane protein [Hanseniaspora uvarum DSM 2768]